MFRHLEQQHSVNLNHDIDKAADNMQQYTASGLTEPSPSHVAWEQHQISNGHHNMQQQQQQQQTFSTESRSDDGNGSSSPKPQRRPTTSRSAMACVLCRKQKMKCEGKDKAPCKRCRAAKVECTFEPSHAGSNLPRARGISKEWIEDRMASVEGRLVKLESRRGSLDSDSSASPSTTSPTTPSSSTAALEARIAQLEAQVFALTFAATGQRPSMLQGNSTPTVLPPHGVYATSQSHFAYAAPAQSQLPLNGGFASQPHGAPPAHVGGAYNDYYPTPNLELPSQATEMFYQQQLSNASAPTLGRDGIAYARHPQDVDSGLR
ncbi:hypothetical protein OIV83_005505 [Microbotryomycetes sp. JL201]|nr:hypothetical protein OIV83_005505 [Microbotryomycetes sp. JL201]